MLKRKNVIITIVISIIVSLAIGFLAGRTLLNNPEKIKNDNTVVDLDSTVKADMENEYPFELYSEFLVNSSDEIVNKLNNNPVDKKFLEKYLACNSLDEEQVVLSEWNIAYEKEFKNAKAFFENCLNKKSTDLKASAKKLLKTTEEYSTYSSAYAEIVAQLSYEFEEFNLGKGTNHTYNLLINSLEINRINTLHLIECIYMLDENYTWIE